MPDNLEKPNPDNNEFNLEDWWEQDSLDSFVRDKTPDVLLFSVVSRTSSTAWGDVGTIGISSIIPEEKMEEILAETFKKLQAIKIADEWFYVTRRCDVLDIHEYITASEDLIYESKTSTKMKNGYVSQQQTEIYFHMLRAYTRAQEGDFLSAQLLWLDIHELWLHHTSDFRKPFVLTALYLNGLCVKEWEQSMKYLKRLWSLVKFMDGNKRYAFGIWDEWITCLLVSWFFMKHSLEFRQVFCEGYLTQSNPFAFQKKSIILQNLNNSFISDIIPEAYYNKARTLIPGLPEIEYKKKQVAHLIS